MEAFYVGLLLALNCDYILSYHFTHLLMFF